jgi:tetratricopeptide (TPR) repeat protein
MRLTRKFVVALFCVAVLGPSFCAVLPTFATPDFNAQDTDVGARSSAKLQKLNAAIIKNTHDAKAYVQRGMFYAAAAMEDKAVPDFNRAIELDPKNPEAYYSRGDLYMKTEEFAKARDDYLKSAELHPIPGFKAMSYRNAGRAMAKLGKHADAVQTLTKALSMADPGTRWSVLLARAQSNFALKRYKETVADVDAMRPPGQLHDEPALALRAAAEIPLEKYQPAIADLTEAIKVSNKKVSSLESMVFATGKDIYYKQRAMCYGKLGRQDLAKADLDKATKAQQESLEFAPFR